MRRRRGEPRPSPNPVRRLLRPSGRQTNQALLVMLLLVFGTGVATVAIGAPDGAWVAVGHGICGMAVVLLIPWKSRVVRGGLRRVRLSRWLSLLLAALALFTLIVGPASPAPLPTQARLHRAPHRLVHQEIFRM